jgi:2-polyprenyl-3-methyl-5-hydroxy-6-metoxy-1,4-benzoquinol methylase
MVGYISPAMSGSDTRATRIDRSLLNDVAHIEPDAAQRDEMAGPSYLHAIPFVRWMFWKRLDVVARFLADDAGAYASGLDFGCGLGVLLPTLSRIARRVYASDLVMAPARRLAASLHLDNVVFIEPAALAWRIAPASLEFVVSTDVLEHVDDLAGVVGRFHLLLKPGGRLIVSGPTENAIYKAARALAGFGGKGGYHHTDIHRIHEHITRRGGGFAVAGRRVLPLPGIVEGFYIYSYRKSG